jgi:hypothetical protein
MHYNNVEEINIQDIICPYKYTNHLHPDFNNSVFYGREKSEEELISFQFSKNLI